MSALSVGAVNAQLLTKHAAMAATRARSRSLCMARAT
jgi:hypothetical protein